MQEIKGKYRSSIYEGNNGYKVGLFKVKWASEELNDIVNKTITFSGYFADFNQEETYLLTGEYTNHPKYGYQFQTNSYEKLEPEGEDAIIEFLSSPIIKGCGEKTAKKIVDKFGEDSINKIKESKNNLLLIDGITEKKATQIYNSIMEYSKTDTLVIDLKKMGFSIRESLSLIKEYSSFVMDMINDNIYQLIELIDFPKLDKIFLVNNDINDNKRVKACIVESLKRISFNRGDIYSSKEEIYKYLHENFGIVLEESEYLGILLSLNNKEITIEKEKYYLKDNYDMEIYIANSLKEINSQKKFKVSKFNELIKEVEKEIKVKYNDEQILSIKSALENSVTIITGGPGTGKTTIINGLVKMFRLVNDWYKEEDVNKIVLLAPTGRASKKMAEATKCGSQTIHRYLKWNKDDNTFGYNENNPHQPKVVIIDETSMVDTYLFNNLLKGISHNCQIIFVGDENQLPSVGAGLTLSDLISSNEFKSVFLKEIYRQSANSYIPFLAKEIKDGNISDEFFSLKDDFRFIESSSSRIKENIKQICDLSIKKSLTEDDIQVLAPMYKGENGIDNLNVLLQEHFNPKSDDKIEIKIGDVIYREKDKIIQLVNDSTNNVYNGDIGVIKRINVHDNKKILEANFDGVIVSYKRDDLINIKHAYAISIHKSQGSEFNHVIMPITSNYSRMLYNKLIYTGVTRAKKSLILIGEYKSLSSAINNNYSENRKTTLKERLNKL